MPPPRNHHFLPRWYLSRWKRNGVVWEFRRVGPENRLEARYRAPAATAYVPNLYTKPDQAADIATQVETDFLQKIDDRGAKSLSMAERNVPAGPSDRGGLNQFLLSLLHRTPDRIEFLENRLREDLEGKPEFKDADPAIYRAAALDVFTDLVASDVVNARLMQFKTFVINLDQDGHDLLTSDRPILMSNGLGHQEAFVILPTGPRTLIVLCEKEEIVSHLANHGAKTLSKALNDAVTIQANNIVIGPDNRQFRFIENRLGDMAKKREVGIDPFTGLAKWRL